MMMNESSHVALVCNPLNGNDKALRVADKVIQILRRKQIPNSVFTQNWPTRWDEFSHVWIFGGDGTANYFINQNPDISLPLSVFKAGSGNDLHWGLYGGMGFEDQVELMVKGNTTLIDAGKVNDKLFLNGLGIGFDGAIVKELHGQKKIPGRAAYLITVLKQIISHREKNFRISFRDQVIEQECFMISVANGRRYGGGFMVAPRAVFTDGALDLSIAGKVPPLKRMKYIPVIEKGEHLDLPFINYSHVESVIIESASIVPAHYDGELVEASRFEVTVLPKKFLFSA
jgi:diacylglycerol kinase (ATP)